jgi:predicted N-acetyltransferase YhbS
MEDSCESADGPGPANRGRYLFKVASTGAEIDQVHRLNHGTFVDEIGQCEASGDGRLVDKFHDKNAYFVALEGGQVVGMVAVHDRPPFSIAGRLADPGELEKLGGRPIEVRLLAVRPEARHGMVVPGLFLAILDHVRRRGYTHLLISGLRQRVPLYEKLGFRALGGGVPSGLLEFVPMVLDPGRLSAASCRTIDRWRTRLEGHRRRRPTPREVRFNLEGPLSRPAGSTGP